MKSLALICVVILGVTVLGGCAQKPSRILSRLPAAPGELYLLRRIVVAPVVDAAGASAAVTDSLGEILTTYLVNTRMFRVFERSQLESVLAEQAIGLDGLTTPQTAARVGSLVGAQAVVLTTLTNFGDKTQSFGGLGLDGGFKLDITNVEVGLDLRIVDTTTGRIIFAHHGSGSARLFGGGLLADDFYIGREVKDDGTLLGKAVRDAVEEVVEAVVLRLEDLPWSGAVAQVSGDRVFINAGQEIGVSPGMRFVVFAAGEELIDPHTGLALGRRESRRGVIEVVEVHQLYSVARPLEGSGFTTGDILREPPRENDVVPPPT